MTGNVYAGHLPPKAERLVSDWISDRRGELMANWERGRVGEPFMQVAGADER